MTMRLSTGLRNFLNKEGAIDSALRNGWIDIFTGAQPTSADAAATGTLLCQLTNNAGVITNEVAATGTLTLTAGSAGTLNTLTVNGADILGAVIPFDGTLAQTASDIAAQINRFKSEPDYTATAAGTVVTITPTPGKGATPNGYVVAAGATTMTASTTNMAGGVTPVNGLLFDTSVAGVMSKLATQTWSGVNLASGVGGWFRQHGSVADANALDSAGALLRIDGALSTAGAEMTLNTTAFTAGATTVLPTWGMTIPAQ